MSNDDRLSEIKAMHHVGGYDRSANNAVAWLIAEVDRLKESREEVFDEFKKRKAECVAARALISWIDGACVVNEPDVDMQIRAAIYRYYKEQKT